MASQQSVVGFPDNILVGKFCTEAGEQRLRFVFYSHDDAQPQLSFSASQTAGPYQIRVLEIDRSNTPCRLENASPSVRTHGNEESANCGRKFNLMRRWVQQFPHYTPRHPLFLAKPSYVSPIRATAGVGQGLGSSL